MTTRTRSRYDDAKHTHIEGEMVRRFDVLKVAYDDGDAVGYLTVGELDGSGQLICYRADADALAASGHPGNDNPMPHGTAHISADRKSMVLVRYDGSPSPQTFEITSLQKLGSPVVAAD